MSDDLHRRLRAVYAEDPAPEWRPLELPEQGERLLVAAPRQHGGSAPRLADLWEAVTMGAEESARFEQDYRRLRDQTHPRVLVDGVVHDLRANHPWAGVEHAYPPPDPLAAARAVAARHLPQAADRRAEYENRLTT